MRILGGHKQPNIRQKSKALEFRISRTLARLIHKNDTNTKQVAKFHIQINTTFAFAYIQILQLFVIHLKFEMIRRTFGKFLKNFYMAKLSGIYNANESLLTSTFEQLSLEPFLTRKIWTVIVWYPLIGQVIHT